MMLPCDVVLLFVDVVCCGCVLRLFVVRLLLMLFAVRCCLLLSLFVVCCLLSCVAYSLFFVVVV